VKVLKTADRVWRAERWRDGWRLYRQGGLVLQHASLGQVSAYLAEQGVNPETLISD
jgi:hypothetical protein